MAMRSRFAEDRLAQAAARGVGQYVIIGAGLDTFPWRQPKFAADLRIFAVDHPLSLGWVQQRLRERRLGRPANLIHVPADLERQMLGEQLKACGFDPGGTGFLLGARRRPLPRPKRGRCLAALRCPARCGK